MASRRCSTITTGRTFRASPPNDQPDLSETKAIALMAAQPF